MKIGVWGDSIVYGSGDENALGWVGLLRKRLTQDDTEVYNLGICGDTTVGLMRRFETELHSINPNVIVLAIGINDSGTLHERGDNITPFALFKDNIRQLLEMAVQKTKKVIVVGLTEVDFRRQDISFWFKKDTMQKYDTCLEEMANEMHLTYVSMHGVLDTQLDLADGLHPDAKGYDKMCKRILPFVEEVSV